MNKKKFAYFLIINCLLSIGSNLVHPVTPTLIVERGLDSSMFGVAFAAMMVMYFLASPFWGKLCNYLPSKRVFLICCIGYGAGQIIFGSAQNETMVILGRMFSGLFCGGANTSVLNQVVNTSNHDKDSFSKNLTTLATFQSVACAVGFFIGGMLGLISVEAAFIGAVLVDVVCGVTGMLFWEDDTPYKVKPDHRLSVKEVNPFRAFMDAKTFMTPLLALLFALIAISFLGQYSYEQCFNYYIKDQYGMTSAYNGIFKAVIALATMLLNSTVCMYLQQKTDINKTFLYVLSVITVLTLGALVFRGQWAFIAIYILFSSVDVVRRPLLQAMTARISTPENSNSMMGFYQAMLSFGSIFGAFFAGVIYDSNPLAPFALAFAAFLLSVIIGIIYRIVYARNEIMLLGGK